MKKGLYLKTKPFNSENVGGSISHTIGMINGFVDTGVELTVITESKLKNVRTEQTVLNIKPYKKPLVIGDFLYQRRYRKATLKHLKSNEDEFDFIYCRHCLFSTVGIEVAKKLGKPLVLEFNSSEPIKFEEMMIPFAIKRHGRILGFFIKLISPLLISVMKKWEDKILNEADKIVVVSEVLKENLIKNNINSDKVIVRSNGVDPQMFKFNNEGRNQIRKKLEIQDNSIVAGFAGTFGNWHGIPEITEAIKKTRNEKNIVYLLIGEGSMKSEMQNELKHFKNVIFVGRIQFEEMPLYLSACDMLIVANSWNPKNGGAFFGSPTKMFEYMAMERAIVSSRLEQLNDILKESDTAITFAPGDSNGLSSAIITGAHDNDLRKKLGRNARENVIAHHTWASNALAIIEHINDKKLEDLKI